METIKFRGKELKTGEWIYGDYTRIWDIGAQGSIHIDHYIHPFTGYEMPKEIDCKTISQYTGIADKEGREIYSGDLLGSLGNDIQEVFYHAKFASFRMKYREEGEYIIFNIQPSTVEHREVIGNIHDNPELLTNG